MKKQILTFVILSSLVFVNGAFAVQIQEPTSCGGQSDNTYNPSGDGSGDPDKKEDGDKSTDASG